MAWSRALEYDMGRGTGMTRETYSGRLIGAGVTGRVYMLSVS